MAASTSPPAATNTSFTTGTPNALQHRLALGLVERDGALRQDDARRRLGVLGALRGSRRRRSAAKRASTAAARASRTGVVTNGTPAASRALTAFSDLACRPDQATCTGLSVLAAAAAITSALWSARGPEIEASRIDS